MDGMSYFALMEKNYIGGFKKPTEFQRKFCPSERLVHGRMLTLLFLRTFTEVVRRFKSYVHEV